MKRALIISLQGIGNAVLLAQAIRALGETKRYAIDLLTFDNGPQHIFENNPHLRRVLLWAAGESDIRNLLRLARELRKTRYDVVYAAHPSWTREYLVSFLCRASRKDGFAGDGIHVLDRILCRLSGTTRPRPARRHDLLGNLELFGIDRAALRPGAPGLYYSDEENERGRLLVPAGKGGSRSFLIALHPGSRGGEKCWPPEHYAALAGMIRARRPGVRFLLLGNRAEAPLLEYLRQRIPGETLPAHGLTLRQSAWLIARCDLFIGNDSAPMHLAAVQNVPSIAIFGPSDEQRNGPLGERSVVIRRKLPCAPCSDLVADVRKNCAHGFRCIRAIAPAEVFRVADRYLEILARDRNADNRGLPPGGKGEFSETGALIVALH